MPLNEEDVSRLADATALPVSDLPVTMLSASERQPGLAAFSHALEKRSDGRCSYLIEEGCSLHNVAKPSMCQLFPYTFMDTPDGTYVGLSFASTGVLGNSGRLLSEQPAEVDSMLVLFRQLFPLLEQETIEGFNNLQLIEGLIITFEQYKILEKPLIDDLERALKDSFKGGSIEFGEAEIKAIQPLTALQILGAFQQSLYDVCTTQCSHANVKSPWQARLPGSVAKPRQIDQFLLAAFAQAFFGSDTSRLVNDRLIAETISALLMAPPEGFKIPLNDGLFSTVQLLDKKLGPLPPAFENLLLRFVYVRVFAKMYFGPGFCGLTLMAGSAHLILVVVLLKLAVKARLLGLKDMFAALPDDIAQIQIRNFDDNYVWFCQLLRQLDSKLTSVRYGANTRAMLEIFALDPERYKRLIDLSA